MKALMLRFTVLVAGFSMLLVGTVGTASAACPGTTTKEAIECGTTNGTGAPVSANPDQSVNDSITAIINYLSVIGGIIAVVVIIIAGYKFMTSGGDSSKVASARTALTYAIIGLIIIALSQVVAKFVLKTSTQTASGSSSQSSSGSSGGSNPVPGRRSGI